MKVVLLRHGECLGNVDESAYTRIPDHALALTAHGEAQATAAGPRIKELVGDARVYAYAPIEPGQDAHSRIDELTAAGADTVIVQGTEEHPDHAPLIAALSR